MNATMIPLGTEVFRRIAAEASFMVTTMNNGMVSDVMNANHSRDTLALNTVLTGMLPNEYSGCNLAVIHVIASERLEAPSITVRDLVDFDVTSVFLVCIDGEGEISTSRNLGDKPTARMEKSVMRQGDFVAIQPKSLYVMQRSTAVYMHFVYALGDVSQDVSVFVEAWYPCPYNAVTGLGDIRVYPRGFVSSLMMNCTYRGSKWKNVLDHLVFCKCNPKRTECEAKQQKRRNRNEVEVECEFCDHPPFRSRNSLVKHKLRKHPASVPPTLEMSQGLADCVSQANMQARLNSILSPEGELIDQNITERKTKKLKRRDRPSLLEQFNSCMSSDETSIPCTEEVSIRLASELLDSVTRSDVRQPCGRVELNAGELSPRGVSQLLGGFCCVDMVGDNDVFADIGAGIGNVVVQLALQSHFCNCVAVEMRAELTTLLHRILVSNEASQPRLSRVKVVVADISEVDISNLPELAAVTHLFSHNTLFTALANFALEDFCWLPKLRVVALSQQFCARHTSRCAKAFCQLWILVKTIAVDVTYKDSDIEIFIYTRNNNIEL